MEKEFTLEKLSDQLNDLSKKNNDKISRSTIRKWVIINWVSIMSYLKSSLVKTDNKKFHKIESNILKVVSVIHNFLNYRIINDLGLTNDEANTKFDQFLIKHIDRITSTFPDELDHVDIIRNEITVNIKDSSGYLCVLPNLVLEAPKTEVLYNMKLKEERIFAVVKRDNSFIKYEKAISKADLLLKYPNTTAVLHGIDDDIDESEIVYFEGIDLLFRSLPADMSYGIRDMDASNEFTLVTVSDLKSMFSDSTIYYNVRASGITDYVRAAENISKLGIINNLDKKIIDDMKKARTLTPSLSNSMIVWDGHPSTFKLAGESNYQLINLRHVDYEQTVTKAIKDIKWTSSFINNIIQVSTGDNMLNVTGATDKLRIGLVEDQKSLREEDIIFPDLIKERPTIESYSIITDGEVNITSRTEKAMRDNLGQVSINGTHTMSVGSTYAKLVMTTVAFIKKQPEHGYTLPSYELIKELKMPKHTKSYEEDESSMSHTFFIKSDMFKKAAKNVLIDNIVTEGPVKSISSVIGTRDLVSSSFGGVPPLEMLNKDERSIKLAEGTFSPFAVNETRLHLNPGCVKADEVDPSEVIKYYGKGKLFTETVDEIIIQVLNSLSLTTHPTDFEMVAEFRPLEYQSLNSSINNCSVLFKTEILRSNQYAIILKLPRTFTHELIYSFDTIELSSIANVAFSTITKSIITNLSYNPYFTIMLGMKYDIDNRFSNEINNVWDMYLLALSGYTDLQKLIIHHSIITDLHSKLVDSDTNESKTEKELEEQKEKHLSVLKAKSKYYTQAINDLEAIPDEVILEAVEKKEMLSVSTEAHNTAMDDKQEEITNMQNDFDQRMLDSEKALNEANKLYEEEKKKNADKVESDKKNNKKK